MRRVLQTVALSAMLTLTLAPLAQAEVKDAWITAKTKIDLMTTDGVRTADLNVDTVDGVVTLHGHVPTAMQRDRAAQVAKSVKGVKSVKNLLQVVTAAQEARVEASDASIKAAVEGALKSNRTLDKSDIHVASVNNHNTTEEKQQAHVLPTDHSSCRCCVLPSAIKLPWGSVRTIVSVPPRRSCQSTGNETLPMRDVPCHCPTNFSVSVG